MTRGQGLREQAGTSITGNEDDGENEDDRGDRDERDNGVIEVMEMIEIYLQCSVFVAAEVRC
jgi:hypothetical protein